MRENCGVVAGPLLPAKPQLLPGDGTPGLLTVSVNPESFPQGREPLQGQWYGLLTSTSSEPKW